MGFGASLSRPVATDGARSLRLVASSASSSNAKSLRACSAYPLGVSRAVQRCLRVSPVTASRRWRKSAAAVIAHRQSIAYLPPPLHSALYSFRALCRGRSARIATLAPEVATRRHDSDSFSSARHPRALQSERATALSLPRAPPVCPRRRTQKSSDLSRAPAGAPSPSARTQNEGPAARRARADARRPLRGPVRVSYVPARA